MSATQYSKPVSNTYAAQRARLLQYLQEKGSITTLAARHRLAVMHVAGRIKELRHLGYSITTYRTVDLDSAGIKHRQGLYVLNFNHSEKENAQQ